MENSTFSLLYLFTGSDIIIRLISISLFLASVYSWSIIIEKYFTIKRIKLATKAFEKAFWSGGSLDELNKKLTNKASDPMSIVFVAAMREWKKSSKILSGKITEAKAGNLYQRIDRIMAITGEQEVEKLNKKTVFLASVGSVAPFMGLFGTVWGIMDSFSAIGASQSTSLGVIAPGIATALSTTALGLIAAIPAVLGYNRINESIEKIVTKLDTFSSEFISIISRQIDESGKF